MGKISNNNYFIEITSFYKKYYQSIVLVMLAISFVTIDMMINLFSISDIILIPLVPVIFLSSYKQISNSHKKFFIGAVSFVLLNTALQYIYNPNLSTNAAIYGTVKIIFYATLFISVITFVRINQLEGFLIVINTKLALLAIVIGIYINLAIYTGSLPYESLWMFLRTDPQSFYFRGSDNLIRMRSLFNEPAHFGFYLNTIIGINFFSSHIKFNPVVVFVLILGVIMTFSFSSIIILSFLIIILLFYKQPSAMNQVNKTHLITMAIMAAITFFLFKEWMEETIVVRFNDIVTGQDNSAIQRIMGSWTYISRENLILGTGIGNAPILFNNYAYFFTEMGLGGALFAILGSLYVISINAGLGLLLVFLNFQKGGYLSASFTLSLLFIYLSIQRKEKNEV